MDYTQQQPFLATLEAMPDLSQNDDDDDKGLCVDWLGRPIGDDRAELMGGWKCSYPIIGASGLANAAFFGILLNLVMYLIQVCGLTNAKAANTVTNISGTISLCSFVGAFVGDAYLGRLWASLIFLILSFLSFASVTLMAFVISKGPATDSERAYLLVALYMVAITEGPTVPKKIVIGADQMTTSEEKEKHFRWLGISMFLGQLFSVTVVSYIDNRGMWAWGFGLCTASLTASILLFMVRVRSFRQYKAAGNPLVRVIQVPVAAWRKRKLSLPGNSSFLDKAAVLGPNEAHDQSNPWLLCTVTQVEDFKCLLGVLPFGFSTILISTTVAQISTLFEEQANVMNRQVTTRFIIPAPSLNVFYIGSAIFTGIVTTACGARLCLGVRRKQGHGKTATSLQMQGLALICSIMAMVIAALVESHRLSLAHNGTLLPVLWLVPQTVIAGAAAYFSTVGGIDFFYSEVPEGMRAISSSILSILEGAGSYLSSLLVALVTAITTQGGQPGWIASNLDEGHVDYFYWFLASCLAFTFCIFLVYTRSYTK